MIAAENNWQRTDCPGMRKKERFIPSLYRTAQGLVFTSLCALCHFLFQQNEATKYFHLHRIRCTGVNIHFYIHAPPVVRRYQSVPPVYSRNILLKCPHFMNPVNKSGPFLYLFSIYFHCFSKTIAHLVAPTSYKETAEEKEDQEHQDDALLKQHS